MSDHIKVFVDTFEYIKQLVQIGQKPIYSLSEYRNVRILESELHGKPGVNHMPDSMDGSSIWLEIERLQRRKAPPPPDKLEPWLNQSHVPTKEPTLKEWILVTVSGEEADTMIEEGAAIKDNVLESPREQEMFDVRLFAKDDVELGNYFRNYLKNKWLPWANDEKPRRETIAIYEKLFAINQTMMAGEVEQPIELVWGIGYALWKVPETDKVISHPILETLVETELDSDTQTLRIRPRSVTQERPRIFTAPFEALQLSGVKALKEHFEKHLNQLEAEEKAIHPADPITFESILRSAVALLSQDACFVPDIIDDVTIRILPRAEESLAITDTWAIYARTRGSNYLVQDLERFQEKAKSDEKVDKSVAIKFVKEPSSEKPKSSGWNLNGRFTTPSPGSLAGEIFKDQKEDGTIYFPKQFNDAQRDIIERLDKADGVVVQGPPGTGKTHTIANIICHYLATGRRVLVTAKSETALDVLKDQIPKEIRPLIISMVSSDREGMQQQKVAIETLQVKVVTLQGRERQICKEIEIGEKEVFRLQQDVREINKQIENFARKQLEPLKLDWADKDFENASVLAKWVVENRNCFIWFPDELGMGEKYTPLFGDEDIEKLIKAKQAVGEDIKYLSLKIPSFSDLPDTKTIELIHHNLVNAKKIESKAIGDGVPRFIEESIETIHVAEGLVQEIKEVQNWFIENDSHWLKDYFDACVYSDRSAPAWLEIVDELRPELDNIIKERRNYLRKPVCHAADEAKKRDRLKTAVERGAAGKSPLSAFQRFDRQAKEIVRSVLVLGKEPASCDDWEHVGNYISFEEKCSELTVRWNAVAVEGPFPEIESDNAAKDFENIGKQLECTESISKKLTDVIWWGLAKVFSNTSGFHKIEPKPEYLSSVIDVIEQNLSIYRLSASEGTIRSAIERLDRHNFLESSHLKEFLRKKVGNANINTEEIIEQWRSQMVRLKYLSTLSSNFETIREVTEKIRQSGARLWADYLSKSPLTENDKEHLLKWREAWRWMRLNSVLRSLDVQNELYSLEEKRQEREKRIKRVFEEVVKNRTFLMLCQNMTDKAKSGLAKFMAAIMNVGRGKGIKAPIFMRAAQKAMLQCAEAIPCWIMPSWRVSEVLPAEFDFFDLVVVDEASQCDVRELPAIARGKKLLIVGDDRQVSPTPQFIEFNKFLQLKYNYLNKQPFGDLMLPGFSLYDLAGAVFPGNKIILNEHFRCVEPIIRFSFRFYDGITIHPLRIPEVTKRIDPPLVDIFVENGQKRGNLNHEEAEVIVDEIEKLINDSRYDARSIGVISLIGRKQASLVQTMLLERIGQEKYLRHHIICGDSATFQGREKDIIFLSMVASPGRSKALTARSNAQRFNVAASRAQDRLYLVRSVNLDELKANDLKAMLIHHFQDPMPRRCDIDQELVELCDSNFEREVFIQLTNKGYLTTPQVSVGDYRIDLVVEGDNDRRLAIELDGDKYHGPERWLEDWTRQKVLERVGWKFWRCWASSYTNAPEGCLNNLIQRLEAMGIKPQESKAKNFAYTDFRCVKTKHEADEDTMQEGSKESELISVGDKVVLSLEDSSEKYVTVLITENRFEPDNLVFDKEHLVSVALIGKTIDDEVEIDILGKHQKVCIVQLAKGKDQEESQSPEPYDFAPTHQAPQGRESHRL